MTLIIHLNTKSPKGKIKDIKQSELGGSKQHSTENHTDLISTQTQHKLIIMSLSEFNLIWEVFEFLIPWLETLELFVVLIKAQNETTPIKKQNSSELRWGKVFLSCPQCWQCAADCNINYALQNDWMIGCNSDLVIGAARVLSLDLQVCNM